MCVVFSQDCAIYWAARSMPLLVCTQPCECEVWSEARRFQLACCERSGTHPHCSQQHHAGLESDANSKIILAPVPACKAPWALFDFCPKRYSAETQETHLKPDKRLCQRVRLCGEARATCASLSAKIVPYTGLQGVCLCWCAHNPANARFGLKCRGSN